MKKSLILLVFGLFLIGTLKSEAQKLSGSGAFSTATPFLEPDRRVQSVKLNADEFVTIAKTKGNLNGESLFVLEKYSSSLTPLFSIPLTVSEQEDFKELFYNGKDIILFSINHNTSDKTSRLLAYGFDPVTGERKWDKELQNTKIGDFTPSITKGKVRESFENCIASCVKLNYVPSFQYQYKLVYSPDSSLFISYIFDYSQKNTIAYVQAYDKQLNSKYKAEIPVDNGFTNYGIFPNNKGELFILNADKMGRVVVIQYDVITKESKLLDVQNASTNREDLTLKVFSDDIVFVANINTKQGQFVGIMYSKFNFSDNLVEKINFHEISVGLKQTINALRESNKFIRGEESWKNYHITHFIINEYEKMILVLEKREILSIEFPYESHAINDIDRWKEKQGKINTEGVLMFSFNMNDETLWENYYLKSQMVDVGSGLLTSSFALDNTSEGKLRMVYGYSDNGSANFNQIHYVEWDEYNGNKTKDIILENNDKMTLMRNYVIWWENKFILAGKKGMMGKKSFLNLYSY